MKTIEINGKRFPCRITMGAMLRFNTETGHDVNQMQPDNVTELIIFLWCCVVSASKVDGVEFGMELMDFADQLDPEALTEFFVDMEQEPTNTEKKTVEEPTS